MFISYYLRLYTIGNNLDDLKKQVKDATRNLSAAESTKRNALDTLREKQEEQETIRKVGIGISLIPVIGWIPGIIMILVSITTLEEVSARDSPHFLSFLTENRHTSNSRSMSNKKRGTLTHVLAAKSEDCTVYSHF